MPGSALGDDIVGCMGQLVQTPWELVHTILYYYLKKKKKQLGQTWYHSLK